MKKCFLGFFILILGESSFAQWINSGTNITNTNSGQVLVGTSTSNSNTDVKMTVYNPASRTTLVVGNPLTGSGGFTSVHLGTSADTGGYGFIEAIKSSGSAFGNLMLNRFGSPVGIGGIYVNSTYKLAVYGRIAAYDEIKVFTNGSSFPDYVFAPNYKLRSLEETETYIKENHHLPEVPSAADIAKEGMSLNGMSEVLLKKVEELTLHLIEMKKDSETLKKENEALKKRLEALENKK